MYYCKVYFFYNIVYDGIKGGGLPVSPPAGCRAGEGLLIALTPAQAPINVLGSSLSPASLRCALPRSVPGPVPHLGCFPGAPSGPSTLSSVWVLRLR